MKSIPEALDDPDAKRDLNRRLFDQIASRYDLATVLLSLGQDQSWKRSLIDSLPDSKPGICLDLATGTGDLVERLARKYPESNIIGLDLSPNMIQLAGKRFQDTDDQKITFQIGDIGNLPFEDQTIDVITGSYALRNVPKLEEAIREIHRVLHPDGVAYFLDFIQPKGTLARRFNHALLHSWCGLVGLVLHGSPRIYRYIPHSLSRFPDTEALSEQLSTAGFKVGPGKTHFAGFLQRIECSPKRPQS